MKLLRFFASIRIFHFSFYIHIRWLDGVGVSVGYISSGSQFFMINPQATLIDFFQVWLLAFCLQVCSDYKPAVKGPVCEI